MIRYGLILLLMLPVFGYCQLPEMTEEQMSNIMRNAQKVQSCMEKIDQSALQQLSIKAQKIQSQLQTLCANNERNKAQKVAMAFSKSYLNSREVTIMKKCSKQMSALIPQIPSIVTDLQDTKQHVCDAY